MSKPTAPPAATPAAEISGLRGRVDRVLRVRVLRVRALWAVGGGVLLGLAFEPYGLWPLLFVALPLLTVSVRPADGTRLRVRTAFGRGYLFGLGMLLVAVSWIHVLGWWVALALIFFEALFFGVLAVILSLTSRLRLWPLAAASAWVLVEFAYSRIPFGGFGWTRIAYAAVDTPLAGFFPLVGVAGVSFLVALTAQLIAWGALAAVRLIGPRRQAAGERTVTPSRLRPVLVAAGLVLVLGLGGTALRGFQVEPLAGTAGTVDVGVVQGNVPGRGIEALGRARSVTNNHLTETIALMTRARLGYVTTPDFILWPENSTDIDPLLDDTTRGTVQAASAVAGIPILVGAVTEGPGPDERQTTALWWDPTRGILAEYHKRNLVPFGEWIPFRTQLLPLIPILAQVGAQSVPGTTPGVLTVPVDGRTIAVGDVICFELAYDDTVYETITRGAQVSMVQSNNATYGGTGQIEQQFAITRARAMETRREIAVATTNSVSGYIDRDGRVVARTSEFTPASLVVTMPLRTAITPAVHVAPWLDRGLALLAVLFVAFALLRPGGSRRRADVRDNGPFGGSSSDDHDVSEAPRTHTGPPPQPVAAGGHEERSPRERP